MKIPMEQFKSLYKSESALYHGLFPGLVKQSDSTTVEIDETKIKEAFRNELHRAVEAGKITPVSEPTAGTPDEPQQLVLTADEIEAEQERRRKAAEAAEAELNAAAARVRFWSTKWGLLDDQWNQDLILKRLKERFQNKLSASAVDTVISELKDQLHFKSAAPEPAPAQAVPPPVPAEVPLPPVPSFMTKDNPLRTRADLGKLRGKYVEYFRGEHGRAFKARVDEILRRGV
jgi:hypothetical protein